MDILVFGWVSSLLVWETVGRVVVLVRILVRPALAGFARGGRGHRPPIVSAVAAVAGRC